METRWPGRVADSGPEPLLPSVPQAAAFSFKGVEGSEGAFSANFLQISTLHRLNIVEIGCAPWGRGCTRWEVERECVRVTD